MPYQSHVSLQQLPPWYEAISRGMLEKAYGLSQTPYAAYPGPRLAPYNPDLERAETLGRKEETYMPYLSAAQKGYEQAATPFTQNYQAYMNPYMQSVLDRIRTEGLRTFNEGILPGLDSRFIKKGTFSGGMHRDLAERAARDVQQSIADRQQQALAAGYQQAGQLHATDMSRQLEAARQIANLGQLRQAGHLADISALESQGERARNLKQQSLDTGYRDFLRQTEHPWQQLSNLSGAISGTPHSSQALQYLHTPPEPQWNRSAQIGQLAGQLYGMNRAGGNRGFKKGGSVNKNFEMKSGLPPVKKVKKMRVR